MRSEVLTIRYSAKDGRFLDEELRAATSRRPLHSIENHFFMFGEIPHLVFVMTWDDGDEVRETACPPSSVEPAARRQAPREKSDLFEGLDDEGRILGQALRRWRGETARRLGLPPYVVLTNRELRAILQARPASALALSRIEGLGQRRIAEHGVAILSILNTAPSKESRPEAEATESVA